MIIVNKKNIIVITRKIYPLDSGDALHTFGMCKQIANYANLIIFSYTRNKTDNTEVAIGQEIGKNVIVKLFENRGYGVVVDKISVICNVLRPDKKYLKSVKEYIKNNRVDCVIIDHICMAPYLYFLRKYKKKIMFIYNSHNVEYLNVKQKLMQDKSKQTYYVRNKQKDIKNKIKVLIHEQIEKHLIKDSNMTFCISKEDIRLLSLHYGFNHKLIFNKPLIHFERTKNKTELQKYKKKLLIAGSMCWYPNVSGVLWFVENVFLNLLEHDYSYQLYIVGNSPDAKIKELNIKYPENIIVTGRVDDISEYFNSCDISIIPIFEGTGAKIKVLESIARGIPTICSTFAAKDYDVTDQIIICERVIDYLNAIRQLENSVELREKLLKKTQDYYKNYMTLSGEIIELFKS
jgi:Glycosyltransferase